MALLHSLDLVFRGLSAGDGPHRHEPASVKKLLKGDAMWAARKTVLGWVLDMVDKTIQVPPHRVEWLHAILAGIPPTQRCTSTKKWQQVIGKLCSMALAVPGARGSKRHCAIRLTMASGCASGAMSTLFWKIFAGWQMVWLLGPPTCSK
jgi:hypothetical protein